MTDVSPDHMSRQTARAAFDIDVRLTLLENDADDRETEIIALRQSINRMTGALMAAALTFGVMAVMFALTAATT